MTTLARVVVLPVQPGPLRIEEVSLPDPGPHQVVIKQLASGICHTQLHQLRAPRPAPILLGHESSGVVLAVGSKVSHVREGNKVAVTWLPRAPQSTARPPGISVIPLAGGEVAISQDVFTWADNTIADEQFVVKLPDDADPELASVIGCAVMTGAGAVLYTARVAQGESVAVFGVGGVGLCVVAAARIAGADPIIAVDLDATKLELARHFGATEEIDASKTDPIGAIHALTRHESLTTVLRLPVSGADHAFDCVGTPATLQQTIAASRTGAFGTRAGGNAVLVAAEGLEAQLNPIDLLVNEKRLIGSLGGSCHPERDLPLFLDWHRDGRFDLAALVTRRYTLDEIEDATTALASGEIQGRAILKF
jgi:Zn-dependent alcohol dehydrogenase